MPRLEVRPEAELDALEAALWYDGERDGLGAEFLQVLRSTFARIEEGPVFFTMEAELVTVMAITHLHRDPRHWQRRE